MANAFFYSSTAVQTQLSGGIGAGSTTAQVSSTVGWPTSYPFVISIDFGAAAEELCTVTNNSLGVLTITRGFDSTSAQSHSIGAVVRHVYCANDATAFRTHEAAVAAIHGVAGTIVGTSDSQTLTNKTYNGGILSGTWSGTAAGTPTFSGAVVFSGGPNISAGGTLNGTFGGTPTFSGATTFSSTAALSGGGSMAGTFTGTPTFSGAVVLSGTPSISAGAALTGTFSGNPTLSGNPTFTGAPVFNGTTGVVFQRSTTTNPAIKVFTTGDVNDRWDVQAGGKLSWGDGTAAVDTNLYRNAVGVLKTDSALTVTGTLTTLGIISGLATGYAEDTTASTTTSTTYAASSTPLSTTVVVPPSGKIEVGFWVRANNSGSNTTTSSYNLSGSSSGTIFTAADAQASDNSGTASIGPFYTGKVYTGLVAGETVTMTAQHKVSAGTGTFSTRQMIMRPLPS